ncbi:MAG: bifunctional hydroxymethylpyrimidine kinase/phosphomethylpyrimidine kinase [Cyclobacteriaceae bacterium]
MLKSICVVGHITQDRIINSNETRNQPGGTAYYFCKALKDFDANCSLVTAVSRSLMPVVSELRQEGIQVTALPSDDSTFFENKYRLNQDHREQKILAVASSFTRDNFPEVESHYFHLGPLLKHDIDPVLMKHLATKGKISLDTQGLLRHFKGERIIPSNWEDRNEILPMVEILKANEQEAATLTGYTNVKEAAQSLFDHGVKEVIITLGSQGSLIYNGHEYFQVPAFIPKAVVDATGCGDTYMAGYLIRRAEGDSIQEAGQFGAAMATLKIEDFGPFSGSTQSVVNVIKTRSIHC